MDPNNFLLFMLAEIIDSIALFFSVISFILYILIPEYMKHPGHLVFVQIICEMMLGAHRLSLLFRNIIEDHKKLCEVLGIISYCAYVSIFFYVTVLALEVIVKYRWRLKSNYLTRNIIYHVGSIISITIMTVISFKYLSLSNNGLALCFFAIDFDDLMAYSVPILVHLPILFYFLFGFGRLYKKKQSKTLKRYKIIVILTICSFILTAFSKFLLYLNDSELFVIIAYLLFSLISFICSYIRMHNTRFFQELVFKCKYKKRNRKVSRNIGGNNEFLLLERPNCRKNSAEADFSEIFKKLTNYVKKI